MRRVKSLKNIKLPNIPRNEAAIRWIDVLGYFVYDDETLNECYAMINSDIKLLWNRKPHVIALVTLFHISKRRNLPFDFKYMEVIVRVKLVHKKQYAGIKPETIKKLEKEIYGKYM